LKAIPVFICATRISDKREVLFTAAMTVGIGFGVLENAYYLLNDGSFNMMDAIIRAFGTGLMHGMCTLLVGFGISFIRKRRKLFAVGTFALLSTAITYHSMFNMLVQSKHPIFGALLPLVTYLPFFVWRHKNKIKSSS
jgi:RsiW-degrading membrane proteinase PrsW (M82 family)